ncbi:PALP-domain-containing protein [Vararia minispora EC-137]|uniref:PALP-domain-containing protein n=1 Tax=Vararia minispora EC-137 TaxID=1314806 RepID=A0ACB8Q8U1_9AGAM|nr:PALP-domain-containing protein [Vararia minispora EC-137]
MSWFPSPTTARSIFYGVLIGCALSMTGASLLRYHRGRQQSEVEFGDAGMRPIEIRSDEILDGVTGLIGNTPLVRINSLSDALGVEILGKAEYMNPGGSVKDRVALRMIEDAEQQGLLYPYTGSRIFEGTVGSTGISLATIARAKGYDTTIIMPDDVATEKVKALEALGAEVQRVRPASIVDKKQVRCLSSYNLARERALHFTNTASDKLPLKSLSSNHAHPHALKHTNSSVVVTTATPHESKDVKESLEEEEELQHKPRGFFADQFENRSNFDAHFSGTGPEIWRQTNGNVHAFVAGAGTGGTVAGTGQFLKSMDDDVVVAIADPDGSGLYNKVKHGVMYDRRESEGRKRRHQVDTVVEGIGINRLTVNISLALSVIDDAFRVTDAEAVSMSRFIVQRDGLFLGSSSACNLVACVRLVQKLGWAAGERVVTILCDSGSRHYSKFWNDEYLVKAGIPVDTGIVQDMLTRPFPPMSSITKI